MQSYRLIIFFFCKILETASFQTEPTESALLQTEQSFQTGPTPFSKVLAYHFLGFLSTKSHVENTR